MVSQSTEIVLALKIAEVEPAEEMHGPLAERMAQVVIRDDDSSRTWTTRVLRQLDDEGWIALNTSPADGFLHASDPVKLVEQEATDAACNNSMRDTRTLKRSRFFVA